MSSYKKIDYRLRVAKSIERRILCSLFQQLGIFYPLKEYQYIGFGSVSFLDFSLFHKSLGIEKMISIEKEVEDKNRFEFNKPYGCIDIVWGESSETLPSINVENKSIIWLDYDDKLSTPILDDIKHVFSRIESGSFFCISYNAQIDTVSQENGTRLKQLSDRIDARYFPQSLNEESPLHKTGLRDVYYSIINNVVEETLSIRQSNGEEIFAEQVLFINYSDGAEINTLGWLFYSRDDEQKMRVVKNSITSYEFHDKKEPFGIKVPLLTYKEMKEIESKFPDIEACIHTYGKQAIVKGPNTNNGFLSISDIRQYYLLYKNFSLFAEIQI